MIGSFSPFASLNRSHASSVARSPRIAVQGSPGIALTNRNTTTMIPMRTGITYNVRRVMKLSIRGDSR